MRYIVQRGDAPGGLRPPDVVIANARLTPEAQCPRTTQREAGFNIQVYHCGRYFQAEHRFGGAAAAG